ncbi:MAG TPA: DapH/DapD/GlmU-related protein [Gemmatimonadaceae bacterium]|nr:DapH/DapD/GlmU-related protein [Gemmatimonadaceae bacterium]
MGLGARLKATFEQFGHLRYEIGILINRRWWRILSVWTTPACWVLVSYRLDRALFLLLGRAYGLVRVLLFPLRLLFDVLGGRHEIHYRADIGRGLVVLHPGLGIVVNARSRIGSDLVLTGGNCIGLRNVFERGEITIGRNVNFGANAVVMGPCTIGDDVAIGAGAVVVSSAPSGSVLVGVPARPLARTTQDTGVADLELVTQTRG